LTPAISCAFKSFQAWILFLPNWQYSEQFLWLVDLVKTERSFPFVYNCIIGGVLIFSAIACKTNEDALCMALLLRGSAADRLLLH
jgi:hypothetical protein